MNYYKLKSLIKNRKNLRILVLSGGFEPERFASNKAGENIVRGLKDAKYKNISHLNVNLKIIKNLLKIKPQFIFPAMLCKWGEDGVIQSLIEVMGIPYAGNGVETSSLCNNKFFFTQFIKSCGINTPSSIVVDSIEELEKIRKKIKLPCIIKPNYQGYSIGVGLCYRKKGLLKMATEAFKYGSRIVIQRYIEGREFTVGVIEVPRKGPVMLPPLELEIIDNTIQDLIVKEDYQKYIKKITNPKLSKTQIKQLEYDCIRVFKLIGGCGVSRFDIRMSKNGKFYFLENNTFPGIPNVDTSLITTQLRTAKIPFRDFIDYMVIAGLKRKEMKTDFIS